MKILFDHSLPFMLAHGGFQIQIEQTKAALERAGVEVEYLHWWDGAQSGDVIHYFGLPNVSRLRLAHTKEIRFVISQLLGGLGARSTWKRHAQRALIGTALNALPVSVLDRIGWSVWNAADAYIALTSWEEKLMREIFRAPEARTHVIPNGVSDVFFDRHVQTRDKWLVTTASIFPVKRLIETARAAVAAQTPYFVIGRPLNESEEYYREFVQLCRSHPEWLRYDGEARNHEQLAEVYQSARGFVLLSRWESQSLSALEAAAAGCPLLLSDLPWARSTFADAAMYCPITSVEDTARQLRSFYDRAPDLPPPPKPARWDDVAQMLLRVYERVLVDPAAR